VGEGGTQRRCRTSPPLLARLPCWRTFNNYFASKEDAIVSLGVLGLSEVGELLRWLPREEPLWPALRAVFHQVFSAAEALDDEQRRAVAELVRATPALRAAQVAADVEAENELAAGDRGPAERWRYGGAVSATGRRGHQPRRAGQLPVLARQTPDHPVRRPSTRH